MAGMVRMGRRRTSQGEFSVESGGCDRYFYNIEKRGRL